ncbi:hypothetical protein K438DRAFT_809376 [Mycena galopus ATCC 62051]|nr:hypothetical protein K438DRAFT_809376 [Mycena galopus ATCC 62051]
MKSRRSGSFNRKRPLLTVRCIHASWFHAAGSGAAPASALLHPSQPAGPWRQPRVYHDPKIWAPSAPRPSTFLRASTLDPRCTIHHQLCMSRHVRDGRAHDLSSPSLRFLSFLSSPLARPLLIFLAYPSARRVGHDERQRRTTRRALAGR